MRERQHVDCGNVEKMVSRKILERDVLLGDYITKFALNKGIERRISERIYSVLILYSYSHCYIKHFGATSSEELQE